MGWAILIVRVALGSFSRIDVHRIDYVLRFRSSLSVHVDRARRHNVQCPSSFISCSLSAVAKSLNVGA